MDLIWRYLVFVRAMMCGPAWLVSMFCRYMMVVCISRVFRVRALMLWCVLLGFVGCSAWGCVACELLLVGCLGARESVGVGVPWGVDMWVGFAPAI